MKLNFGIIIVQKIKKWSLLFIINTRISSVSIKSPVNFAYNFYSSLIRVAVKFARVYKLHEETKLHGDFFGRADNFARRNFTGWISFFSFKFFINFNILFFYSVFFTITVTPNPYPQSVTFFCYLIFLFYFLFLVIKYYYFFKITIFYYHCYP